MNKVNKVEDTSFIYFTNPEVIKSMVIDPRLIPIFKNVMIKMQKRFNKNGYTKDRDYFKFFQERFLNKEKPFKFIVDEIIKKKRSSGLYYKLERKIEIDKDLLKNNPYKAQAVLYHEMVHLIVDEKLPIKLDKKGKIKKPSIIKERKNFFKKLNVWHSKFINEGLTELFTKEEYPFTNAYSNIVEMQKFANLFDKNADYRNFLKGKIYGIPNNIYGLKVLKDSEKYYNIEETADEKTILKIYRNIQRNIIRGFSSKEYLKNFDDYLRFIKNLEYRPVKDNIFINKTLRKIENRVIKDTGEKDEVVLDLMRILIKESKLLTREMHKYKGADVASVFFNDKIIDIDKNINVYCKEEIYIDRIGEKLIIKDNNGKIEVNIKDLDFKSRRKYLESNLKRISNFFGESRSENIEAIKELVSKNRKDIISLKQFKLPVFGEGKAKNIYITGTGKDEDFLYKYKGIELLRNFYINKSLDTEKDDNNINTQKIKKSNIGMVFSTYSIDEINRRIDEKFKKEILSEEQRNKIIADIAKKGPKFVVYIDNNEIKVGGIYENNGEFIVCESESEEILNKNYGKIYNRIYNEFLNRKKGLDYKGRDKKTMRIISYKNKNKGREERD